MHSSRSSSCTLGRSQNWTEMMQVGNRGMLKLKDSNDPAWPGYVVPHEKVPLQFVGSLPGGDSIAIALYGKHDFKYITKESEFEMKDDAEFQNILEEAKKNGQETLARACFRALDSLPNWLLHSSSSPSPAAIDAKQNAVEINGVSPLVAEEDQAADSAPAAEQDEEAVSAPTAEQDRGSNPATTTEDREVIPAPAVEETQKVMSRHAAEVNQAQHWAPSRPTKLKDPSQAYVSDAKRKAVDNDSHQSAPPRKRTVFEQKVNQTTAQIGLDDCFIVEAKKVDRPRTNIKELKVKQETREPWRWFARHDAGGRTHLDSHRSTVRQEIGETSMWTTQHDAGLLMCRDEVCPTSSWNDVADTFNNDFQTSYTPKWLHDRYKALDKARDHVPSPQAAAEVGDEASEDDHIPEHPELSADAMQKWTAQEDANLISLREDHMKDAEWMAIHNKWRRLWPNSNRSYNALCTRYRDWLCLNKHRRITLKECLELRDRATAYTLEYGLDARLGQHRSEDHRRCRSWTITHDAELIRLREDVYKAPQWGVITIKFNQRFDKKRTKGALMRRYSNILGPQALGGTWMTKQQCRELRNRARHHIPLLSPPPSDWGLFDSPANCDDDYRTGLRWSVAENAQLIQLREEVMPSATMQEVAQVFLGDHPTRTFSAVDTHYHKTLKERATGTSGDATYARRTRSRALAYIEEQAAKEAGKQSKQTRPVYQAHVGAESANNLTAPVRRGFIFGRRYQGISDEGRRRRVRDVSEVEDKIAEDDRHGTNNSDESATDDENDGDEEDNDADVEEGEGSEDDDNASDDLEGDQIIIEIGSGEDMIPYPVPAESLYGNERFIRDAVDTDADPNIVIRGPRWAKMKPDDFRPVYEYLRYGDYWPQLSEDGDEFQDNDEVDHVRETLRCGEIFALARRLDLPKLMELAHSKLIVLEKPATELRLATLAALKDDVDESAGEIEEQMRATLTEELAKHWWTYIETELDEWRKFAKEMPDLYAEVMVKHGELNKDESLREKENENP